ncbi:ATP-binding protein [Mycolicibacterium sp.]|uniref:ATP-binding protein n=1 Tax=Mycolicibacterium sp. TaxID=2320850 RepID=UPI001D3EB6CE|nr:ATP-binding protein [Mycolicibacterium sp.]MCB1290406.1 ATP-binding protein [Mycobacterium sp.]MCB9407983.1 ATP-binding protein [Mycolicibacterium sp.]
MPAPHSFSVRYSSADHPGYWHEVAMLGNGRTGILVGRCTDPESADRCRSAARSALLETGDPVRSLEDVKESTVSALCAVIDATTISYRTHGDSDTAVAVPDATPQLLEHAEGRVQVEKLPPGATVLMSAGSVGSAVMALDSCESLGTEQLAEEVIARMLGAGEQGVAVVLYRHPPEPLRITLPAEASNLAVSRGRLRRWLAAADVDPESGADLVLAAGEAAANATEHAVVGADRSVMITLTAALTGNRLRLTVSDTGVWKPAPESPGHRGHGLPLINALVDSVELSTTAEGTTVSMLKELHS